MKQQAALVKPVGEVDSLFPQHPFPLWIFAVILKSIVVACWVCAISLLLAFAAHAATDEVRLSEIKRGQLLFKGEQNDSYRLAPMLNTDVQIDVTGMVVRARLTQRFENPDDGWVEGIYVFPLPENAAVDHMRMVVGERIIEGQVKEREVAKRTYTQAKQQGKKAALIEQERPNMFTTSVANIGPNEVISIEIEYQQVLDYSAGQFTLRFPMAITPRYIPAGEPLLTEERVDSFSTDGWAANTIQVPDAERITPPYSKAQNGSVSLSINLDAGFELSQLRSRYHDIDIEHRSARQKHINLTSVTVPPDRDFELLWSPKAGNAPKAALFTEQLDDGFYHLLMVLPPEPEKRQAQSLQREVIYVIDTSGSMHGTSIQQAREALLMALPRLRSGDRFNVIEFNSNTRKLFSKAREVSEKNLRWARAFVSSLSANGGTEIASALKAALPQRPRGEALRQVVFLTDGSVGNEKALFSLIEKQLGGSRLFTVGIGSAPNSYFMRKAARLGRGTFTYIGDVNEVKEKMAALFRKLESPVMSDLKLSFGQQAAEIWPQRLPDLYLGEPLMISAKTEKNVGHISINGQRLNEQWSIALPLGGGDAAGMGVLWARNKIDSLMDQLRHQADGGEIKNQIIDVALTHHLVSRYTSLVAVDVTPTRPVEEMLHQRKVPLTLPHGQSHQKIFGKLPQTSTSAQLQITAGLVLLLIAFAMRKKLC